MPATNDEVVGIYLHEVPKGGLRGGGVGPTLRIEEGRLIYHRRAGYKRTRFGPVTLVHWCDRTQTFVINGNMFTDNSANQQRDLVRSIIQPDSRPPNRRFGQRVLRARNGRGPRFTAFAEGLGKYVLVPFQALEAAGIDLDTIKPIDVEQDHWQEIRHRLPHPPAEPTKNDLPVHPATTTFERTKEKVRFRRQGRWEKQVLPERNSQAARVYGYSWRSFLPYDYRRTSGGWIERWNWVWNPQWEVWAADYDGIWEWRPAQTNGRPWFWTENVHHLGGCLFSARSTEDGQRHKYVSAFDRHENPPLYFLAQLPDRSGATTLAGAIEALKPPLVKKAEQEGRRVFRQGDIFAIQTDLTEKQVYAQARTRVRRSVVDQQWGSIREMAGIAQPADGEVIEWTDCPCGCGHRRKYGFGPRARRALSIYRTGHTATEVVVLKDGATMIRDHMHHDPWLETPGRMADHRPQKLPEGWFLCVRNTVPRRKARPQPVEQQEQAQEREAA